jgi:hypothetical protein
VIFEVLVLVVILMEKDKERIAVLPKKLGGGPHGLGRYYLHDISVGT